MQRNKELVVEGKRYETTQYSGTFGLRLLTRLTKIIGKPLAILATTKQDKKITEDLVSTAIDSIIGYIEEDFVVALIKDILSTTQIIEGDGKRRVIEIDTDFAGSYGHLFKVTKEILTFQYSDFFADLAAVNPFTGQARKPTVKARA